MQLGNSLTNGSSKVNARNGLSHSGMAVLVILYREYHLKRNPTTVTFFVQKVKSEADPLPCKRLS
jgi:hypothetical protein